MNNSGSDHQGKRSNRERIKLDLLIHDLKVPLAVIDAGVTALLNRTEKYGALTDKQIRVLTRALRNTRVTQALVGDALELGRSRAGITNLNRCRVAGLVEETLIEVFDLSYHPLSEDVRSGKSLRSLQEALAERDISLRIDEALWSEDLLLDAAKVRQILRNLLTNAFKYRKKEVEMNITRLEETLRLAVQDDGDGIPREFHQRIFDCYFQIEGGESCPVRGHGLGLAGVMVLVEDMGGRMHLDSDAGQGARFTVELPLGAERSAQSA